MAHSPITPPSFGDSNYWFDSWSNSYATCLPNCTVFVCGKRKEMGLDCPTGFGADYDFRLSGWTLISSVDDVRPGDVVEYHGYSIGIVVSGSGRNATCHHSWYTTVSGSAHNYDGALMRYATDATGSTAQSVFDYCVSNFQNSRYNYRCFFSHNVQSDGNGGFWRAFRSGAAPEPQPEPQPGDNWHWEDTTWTIETTSHVPHEVYYTDIYECGTGTFGDQSGDQDTPRAPEVISTSTSRENQRWEPFNMYTYERALTYASNKNPIWSSWDLKAQGSDNFPLGVQPQYGMGWEVNWN